MAKNQKKGKRRNKKAPVMSKVMWEKHISDGLAGGSEVMKVHGQLMQKVRLCIQQAQTQITQAGDAFPVKVAQTVATLSASIAPIMERGVEMVKEAAELEARAPEYFPHDDIKLQQWLQELMMFEGEIINIDEAHLVTFIDAIAHIMEDPEQALEKIEEIEAEEAAAAKKQELAEAIPGAIKEIAEKQLEETGFNKALEAHKEKQEVVNND